MSDAIAASAARAGYRWVVLALAWAAFAITFIDRLAWGNLQLGVGRSLGLAIGQLGLFVSAFYAGYVVSNLAAGFLADRFGPRRMLAASALLLGAATVAFAQTRGLASGTAWQALMGLAAGADYAGCVALLAAWFPPRTRGLAIGLWYTGSSLAVVLTNVLVPPLAGMAGWQGAYRVLGLLTIAIGVACWAALRDRPQDAPARRRPPPAAALLRQPNMILVGLAGFGALWGTWGFAFWSNALMVRGHGIAPGAAAGIVALFGLGAIIAKPVIGFISDRLGGARRGPALVCLLAFALMLLLFGRLESAAAFRLAAPFLGITAFGYSPLMTALVAELAGTARAGTASGATNAFWQIGNMAVPAVVGLVFARTLSFGWAFATLAAGPLFAVLCLLAVRPGAGAPSCDAARARPAGGPGARGGRSSGPS